MSEFTFSIASTPELLNNDGSNFRAWKRVVMADSLLNYYPTCEIFVPDYIGEITEDLFFSESITLHTKLGHDELGYLDHNFYWSEAQLNNSPPEARHISGDYIFILMSHFRFQDTPKSRSWNKNISDIVTEIASEYTFPSNTYNKRGQDYYITETNNHGTWYQPNTTDRYLIESLFAKKAISTINNQLSPFISFFNLKGEFYFSSIENLYNQKPVDTYYLVEDQEAGTDINRIAEHELLFGGAAVNLENYNKTFYYTDETGNYIKRDNSSIKDYIHHTDSRNRGQYTILKENINTPREIIYTGMLNNDRMNDMAGLINNYFIESLFTYRMKIVSYFHPESVAGRTVNLTVESYDSINTKISQEYSGKWLILESQHFIDSSGVPSTELLLAKPSIHIHNNHPLKDQFVT